MFLQRVYNRLVRASQSFIFKSVGKDPLTRLPILSSISMEKLGGDSFWIIPQNSISNQSICYLIGAGEDISFDIALANKFEPTILIFDPTPRAKLHFEKLKKQVVPASNDLTQMTEKALKRITFHEIGLWNNSETIRFYEPQNPSNVSHSIVNLQKTDRYFEAPVERLSTLMKQFGHTKIDLFKLDIEGAEYTVLETLIEDKIYPAVLCIEYDEAYHSIDSGYVNRIKQSLESLRNIGYQIANVEHPGNYTLVFKPAQ